MEGCKGILSDDKWIREKNVDKSAELYKSQEANRALQTPERDKPTEINGSRDQKAHPYLSAHRERIFTACEVPISNHM